MCIQMMLRALLQSMPLRKISVQSQDALVALLQSMLLQNLMSQVFTAQEKTLAWRLCSEKLAPKPQQM